MQLRRRVAAVMSAALGLTLLAGAPAQATGGERLKPQVERLDSHGGPVKGEGWTENRLKNASLPKAVWPSARTARIPANGRRAGDLPVWATASAGSGLSELNVEVLDRAALPKRWRDGLMVRVGAQAAGQAKISVDYNSFRYASGGDWASRLKLWQVPDCALSTPDRSGCQPAPLRTSNDESAGVATAEVSAGTQSTMLMLAAAAAGSSGDFSATSLAPSSTWSAGGSSGAFSWNYPLRLPPVTAGPQPSISLGYSSSAVDGRSEATNNQPSWIGEGFDFWPGYIERRYVPCSEDMKNGNINTTKTGDQCWRSDNATMSLNGAGGELIFESGKGWHNRTEDGSKIEKLTGVSNGDNDGEYWKVTTKDGTQYFFGRNNLPGQSAATESVNTGRVYGNHSGEPCYQSTFANAHCDQAWRWNLDYVIDVRGNTMSYWYAKQWQKYAANNTNTSVVPYVRDSTLSRIDYGTYWRTAAEHGVDEQSVAPAAQIVFDVADRCLTNCWSGSEPVKENWPDTPHDQDCKMTATSCDGKHSPTFWTTKRLSKITTKVQAQVVESWTLTHAFPSPGDGTHAGLWLDSIVHAGHVGGTLTMAPVTFEPTSMPNRVLTGHNTTNNWLRISNVITETGARIHVDYSLPECTDGNKPAEAHNNTMRCYPVIVPDYSADPSGDTLMTEWWHKYVVTHVADEDVRLADGHQAPTKNTWYEYVGAPAWHYADDDGLSKPDRKTWSQFRGYQTVKTRVGDSSADQTLSVGTYLRGMHGDRLTPSGGTRSVTVGASIGSETVYDEDQFAGMLREETIYNGVESKPVSRKVSAPWRSSPTASRTVNGDMVESRHTAATVEYGATALGVDGARGWRISRSEQNFDDVYGTLNWSRNDGDIAVTGDEKCVGYTYNRNTAKNIVATVKQVTTTTLACGQNPQTIDDIQADVRYYYDGATSLTTAPTAGAATKVEQLKNWTLAGGTQWETVSQSTYDSSGRPATNTDLKGNLTTTGYTPVAGGPVTKVTTTHPAPYNWVSSVEVNPWWGSSTKVTDVNSKVTGEADYDPLGRVTKVWNLGWTRAANPNTPSTEYSYLMPASRDTYPAITTKALNPKGNYITSHQILDGLLRTRQTQAISLSGDGARIVSDTIYDALGRSAVSYGAHAEPGAPSNTLWWEPEWSVPSVTKAEMDQASRTTASVLYAGDGVTNLVEKSRASTIFEGDLAKVSPPAGGVAATTVTDVEGRTVALRRHKTAAGVGGAYDETRYLFNRKGQTWKTIDPAGNEWVYTYDAKGRQASSKDPDKGTSYSEYNDYNELVKSTDSRGEALFRVYDQIGRKKELRDDSATGALRAEWKYDTLYSGQTGFRGQQTQTIRYEPAGSANAYKWQVRQFDGRYQPGGINIVIPAVETGLNTTYVYSYSYSSFTGAPTAITFPAAGDLPVEQITTDYDSVTGQPVRLDTNRTGQSGTMLATWYTAFGERSLTTRKLPGGVYVDDSIEYDDYTRQVKRTTVKPETAAGTVSDTNYSYDTAGNIISIAEKPQVGSSETQCFRYNRLNRLSTAWTPKSGVSCTPDPVVSDLGGPAQYWKDWTFDSTGGRLSEVSHAVAGNTTRAYTFPAGGAAVTRPHAVTRMTTSAPGVSDVSLNYQYDNAGNTICRPNGTAANTCPAGTGSQVPGWNAEGKLETVTGATTETSVYDINGVRLIRRDATGTTLYLPGQEIRREGTVNKGTRYYSFAGKTCASRNGTALTWLYGDHQGTDELSVRADTQAVSIRRQTPYGESRGTPPAWANQKGFVGGDKDATGLTNLGARRYDPVLGRFISVDPLLVATDPDQFNGYQYGGGNPIRFSDPTGERLEDDNGGDGRVTNPWSSDEEERANTGGADRAEMLRNFRRDQIKSGAKEMSAIRLKLMEMADIDFKAQGRGKGLATFVENWVEDKLFNTLLDTFLGRIDESRGNSEVRVGTKENGRGDFAGFNNEEFEIAFILAMDGSNVVSKDDNITSVGATNRRSFDAWVDGVRSEFKTPQKDSERSGKSAWEGADGQNAERLYIYSKTIDKKALGQGRSAHLSSKKGSSGTDYKHYRVVEMDVTGLHGWSTDLTPIGEPIDCNGWDWFVC